MISAPRALEPPGGDELAAARQRLSGSIRVTPTVELGALSPSPGGRVVLKLELLQHTGSFKARGALNALMSGSSPAGVTTASGGNHGAAVAWAAARCGVSASVFVPSSSPALKAARIRSYGAELHLIDGLYADALEASVCHAALTGARQVHAYDDPLVVAGQASLGTEVLTQVPSVTTVLVSCGGGGLYAGVALACAGSARVIPVEPETAQALHAAVLARHPVPVEVSGVAVDSLGARQAGSIATSVAVRSGVNSLVVTDAAISETQRLLWEQFRIVSEPGGATALAALVGGAYEVGEDETVVVVVSGANTATLPAGRL